MSDGVSVRMFSVRCPLEQCQEEFYRTAPPSVPLEDESVCPSCGVRLEYEFKESEEAEFVCAVSALPEESGDE